MFTLEKKTISNWKSKLLCQETRKRSNKARKQGYGTK